MSSNSLVISKCPSCQNTFWPTRKNCSSCFELTKQIEASKKGKIIEFSKKDDVYFCVTEFDKIRFICTLKSEKPPVVGNEAKFLRHNKSNNQDIFEITI